MVTQVCTIDRFTYPGGAMRVHSECRVRIVDHLLSGGERLTVVELVELEDNPGMSVTNAVPGLMDHVTRQLLLDERGSTPAVRWLESTSCLHPDEPESWEEVTRSGERVAWRRISSAEAQELLGDLHI